MMTEGGRQAEKSRVGANAKFQIPLPVIFGLVGQEEMQAWRAVLLE